MKISTIKQKATEKKNRLGTYHIEDGTHDGVLQSVEYNEDNDRVYLKIKLADGTVYKSSAELADYDHEPLFKIIEPFIVDDDVDFSDIKDFDVTFTTENNTSKDGRVFSNITDIEYLYSDDESDD